MQAGVENGFIDHGMFHSSAVGGDLAAHASLIGLAISTASVLFSYRDEVVTEKRASVRRANVCGLGQVGEGGGWGGEGQLPSKLFIVVSATRRHGNRCMGANRGCAFSLVTATAEIRQETGIMML